MKQTLVIAGMTGLIVCAAFAAGEGQQAPATVGWRQNWTGRFPDATPPVTWSRSLKDSMVKGLRVQVKKPGAGVGGTAGIPLADGALLQYLALGPFTPTNPATGLDEVLLPNEAEIQPDEAVKVGELEWKSLTQGRPRFVLHGVAPVPFIRVFGKPKIGQIAYAHAYLYSAKAGKVALMLDHTGGCKLWVNGKVVYNNPKVAIGFGWWGPMSEGDLNYRPKSRSPRIEIELKEGWNNLVFKVSGSDTEWGQGWSFLPRFIDIPPVQYEDKNIAWTARLPSRSNANPIIVKDRIFVVSEQDELLCFDKKTGTLLWNALNNYYEATPQAERDANPVFKEIAPLEEQVKTEQDPEKRRDLFGQIRGLLNKADAQKYGQNMESHPAGHWYSTGFTTPSPCSDGKFVYAFFTSGVAVCYDLDGKRQWIKRIDLLLRDPKEPYGPFFYPQGCTLVGSKFVIWDKDTFALDAKTGEIAWRKAGVNLCMGPMPGTFSNTEVVVSMAGIYRASDGVEFWKNDDAKYLGAGGGTFVDRQLCIPIACGGLGCHVYDFASATGDVLPPAKRACGISAPEQTKSPGDDFSKPGEWQDLGIYSAPIYNDGLVYIVDGLALLYVVDAKEGKLLYRLQLPLEPRVEVRAVALTAPLVLAGKNIYAFDNQGNCVVFEVGREYKQVALNHIETFVDRPHTGDGWQELSTYGAPIVDGNRMYIRGEANLYCIGEK